MPINTDLNIAPYFDDFDSESQFYKILFKPGYAVQARELTQIQSILQNQVETFGDNIFQEGSIVKGCTFTNLSKLEYVKLTDKAGFDVESYISRQVVEEIAGVDTDIDIVYEVEGDVTGLKAKIIQAARGFETRPPDLNTFFINYLTTNEASNYKVFQRGELLKINRYKYNGDTLTETSLDVQRINVSRAAGETGKSFGIQSAPGVIFQKGNFLFTEAQTVIVEKYSNSPNLKSVGFDVTETIVSSLQDGTLFDNANGSTNENAPGADRLKLTPLLVVKETSLADTDADFFTLIRYVDGNAVQLRDVSQYNALGDEMARRTYEESGNYITSEFKARSEKRGDDTKVVVSPGIAYVKGYRVENGGEQSFTVDPIANTVTAENQPVNVQYGGYITVDDIRGTVDLGYNEADLEEGGTVIGKTFIRNITQDKVYLFGSRITTPNKSFADVTQIDSTAGRILVSNSAVVAEQSKTPMVFSTGVFSVKGTTDIIVPIRDTITGATITAGEITLTNGGGVYDYAVNNDDVVVVDSLNSNRSITSATSQSNDSELRIVVGGAASGTATVYVNRRIQVSSPYNKTAVKPFIKCNYLQGTSAYSLGFPDVYQIVSVEDASGTDFTNSFRLQTNQKDAYYDISYMEHIPGRPKPADGVITVKLGVFELNDATGDYYFTINSYPIDDTTAVLPSNKVRSQDLAVYTGSNRKSYNLRESVDFRPYVDKVSNADYNATTAGAAPIITAEADGTTPVFSRSDYIVPANDESLDMDIESYNARIDLVTIDSYGTVELVKGEEEQAPSPSKISKDKLVISEILVPGYPALSAYEADRQKKPEYALRTRSRGTRRYTMSDIAQIDDRIDRLEYYVSLSSLEQSVENLNVLDENGLTRFKNGYIAEPFENLTFANMEDPLFSSAVLFDKKILTPRVTTFPMSLKYKESTSSTIFPTTAVADTGTLSRNSHVQIIKQPYGTSFRNCVSNFYQYNGVGQLSPEHDFGVDTVVNPVPVVIDISTPFEDFADAIQEFLPLTGSRTSTSLVSRTTRGRTTTTTNALTTTTRSLDINENTAENQVGDFVSNLDFLPFIRPREVKVYITGLRPNTQHYFFFDGQTIDDNVTPGTSAANNARSVDKFGEAGDSVTTDANGILRAVFNIPGETFYVGERKLEVADVSQYSSIESAGTSEAKLSYHAYNIDIEKTSLQTRVPSIDIETSTTTRNVTTRRTRPRENRGGDPLAQTFFIKSGMGKGVDTVMLSKVDLYFRRKSTVNGVNIQIREVVNGYPSSEIITFGSVHLNPSDVNVSNDASTVTTVDFEAPLRLETETEYAIVIKPDANDPNYLVYTSKVGETDLTPGNTQGQAVVQDWGDGVLFTSTNNRSWKSYQDEDLKFTLYRHDFNASSGSITLTSNDNEFITLSDWDGQFIQDEFAYQVKPRSGSTLEAMSISVGSATITGTALDDTYAAGDFVKIQNSGATREDVFEITAVDSATTMTVAKASSFAGTAGLPVVVGKVSYHNFRRPETLYLDQSSATTTFNFEANTVVGLTSGTEGTISTVDNINLSYIQPMIQKTNDSTSRTTVEGKFVDTNNTNNYYKHPMKFADSVYFTQNGTVVYSKTNNLADTKPFDITINMTNGSNATSSPLIDIETSMLLANQYNIGNDANTASAYVSSVIELAEDLDAEDIKVYLTGYRPKDTQIKVYIKPQHSYDNESFANLNWIELEITEGARAFSSSSNADDYKEFVYGVAAANKNADDALFYTSGDGGDFVGFRKFAIRIDLLSPNIHRVPTVADYRAIAIT